MDKGQAALKYLRSGLSVMPVNNNSKVPSGVWKSYQEELPTEGYIKNHWKKNPEHNVGLICGKLSNRIVVDIDSYRHKDALDAFREIVGDKAITHTVRTGRGGWHFHYLYGEGVPTCEPIEGLEIKSEGAYVLLPPSTAHGSVYRTVQEMQPTIFPIELARLVNDRGFKVGAVPDIAVGENIPDGKRDETLFTLAHHLIKGGMPYEKAAGYVVMYAKHCCNPPVSEEIALQKIKSSLNRNGKRTSGITEIVKEWIKENPGTFFVDNMMKEEVFHQVDKASVRKVINRMVEKQELHRLERQGQFRAPDTEISEISLDRVDTQEVKVKMPLNLGWPNGPVIMMPKNIVIFAGAPNTGKTAVMLNILRMNRHRWANKIHYFSSEMGQMELRSRLEQFRDPQDPSLWPVRVYERSTNFADVLDPDGLNIIDYLEISDAFYQIGGMIRDIHDRLRNGIAVIALQKDTGKDHGRGGLFSLEKARLFCTLDRAPSGKGQVVKIVKAKNWRYGDHNPNGMWQTYKLVSGCHMYSDSVTDNHPEGKWRRGEVT